MPSKKLNPRRHEEIVRLRNAEELFAKIESQAHFHKRTGWRPTRLGADNDAMKEPYTPPSNILAARKHEVEYKGRDYAALTEAAKRKPVGYWADAPRGKPFGALPTCKKCGMPYIGEHHCNAGGNHIVDANKMVSTAPSDSSWPKWVSNGNRECIRLEEAELSEWFSRDGSRGKCLAYVYEPRATDRDLRYITQAEAIAWLKQNGHAEYASTLEAPAPQAQGKPEPMGDGVVRAWDSIDPVGFTWLCVGVIRYTKHDGKWRRQGEMGPRPERTFTTLGYTELPHPEALALWDECRKALKIEGEGRHAQ